MFGIRRGPTAALALFVVMPSVWADDKKPAEEKVAGPDGLTLTVRMQGPYDADVPLQVVGYFKPKAADDTLKEAPVELENRAALARYLGVSRARVTQVLRRLGTQSMEGRQRVQGYAVKPPSIIRLAPVTKPASGPAR